MAGVWRRTGKQGVGRARAGSSPTRRIGRIWREGPDTPSHAVWIEWEDGDSCNRATKPCPARSQAQGQRRWERPVAAVHW